MAGNSAACSPLLSEQAGAAAFVTPPPVLPALPKHRSLPPRLCHLPPVPYSGSLARKRRWEESRDLRPHGAFIWSWNMPGGGCAAQSPMQRVRKARTFLLASGSSGLPQANVVLQLPKEASLQILKASAPGNPTSTLPFWLLVTLSHTLNVICTIIGDSDSLRER